MLISHAVNLQIDEAEQPIEVPTAGGEGTPMQSSALSMLVPSLSQHLLVTDLVKGDGIDPLLALLSAGVTVAVGMGCTLATTRRYGSERMLI